MIDKSRIGTEMPSHSTIVEANRLRLFAKATGQTDPIYVDESAAMAAGYRGLPMPPTMAFCFDMDVPNPFEILDVLDVELGRLLHGEQHFEYLGDVCAGDTLTYRTTISDIYDKKGRSGRMIFIVSRMELFDETEALLATTDSRMVIRERPDQ